jgi:hypothetical protein
LRAAPPPLGPPQAPLIDFVAAAYASPSAPALRKLFPRLLLACFPWPDVDTDLGDVEVHRSLLFLLREAAVSPAMDAFQELPGLIDEFEQATLVATTLSSTSRPHAADLVEACILAPLAEGKRVLLGAGYANPDDSHAVDLYFVPLPGQQVRLLDFDRADVSADYHVTDDLGRPLPLVLDLDGVALRSPAARAALGHLLHMQRPHRRNNLVAFHTALETLRQAAKGTLRVGKLGGRQAADFTLPGQSPQTGGTCGVHCNWAWLRYALFASRGPSEGEVAYKALKAACRTVLLNQALVALAAAQASGDAALAKSLRKALRKTRAWLEVRQDAHPAHRSLWEQLARVP